MENKIIVGVGAVLLGLLAFLQSYKDTKIYLWVGIILTIFGFIVLLIPSKDAKKNK